MFVTVLLSLGLLTTMLAGGVRVNLAAVFWLTILSYPLIHWALKEDIRGIKKITLFILPMMLIFAAGTAYFLIPVRWLTRMVTVMAFSLSLYAALLTVNIYNVASTRQIGLLRVGRTMGFFLTITVILLLNNTLFSTRPPFWLAGLGAAVIAALASFADLWALKFGEGLNKQTLVYALVIALLTGQFAAAISFWPLAPSISAILVTTVVYELLGLSSHFLGKTLYQKTLQEFALVAVAVFLIVLLTTSWQGR